MLEVKKLVDDYLKPLSKATERIFRSAKLRKSDRCYLRIDDKCEHFITEVYSETFRPFNKLGWNPRNQIRQAIKVTPVGIVYKDYASAGARSWQNRVPEHRTLSFQTHEFAATDFSALVIQHIWLADQIIYSRNLARDWLQHLLIRFYLQSRNAKRISDWREGEKLESNGLLDNKENPLAEYQKVAVTNYLTSGSYALFMRQGTGKSAVVVSAICNEAVKKPKGKLYKALIIAPKSVQTNWKNELKKFASVNGKMAVARGTDLDRMKIMLENITPDKKSKWSATIITYASAMRSWDAIKLGNWDLVVLDESHSIKSIRAKTTKFMLKLRDICKKRLILTGTPIANSLFDIFTQLEFLEKGGSGFSSYNAFRKFHGKFETIGGQKVITDYQNIPMFQERLSRCSIIINQKEALPDLPDRRYRILEAEMSDEQQEVYKQISNQLYIEIQDDLDKAQNKEMAITNVLTKLLRLTQITAGYMTWDAKKNLDGKVLVPQTMDRFDPNPKLEVLVEAIKEKDFDQKCLVSSCWVPNIKQIAARLTHEGIHCCTMYGGMNDKQREKAKHDFNNDPTCKVMVLNPTVGGVGLNLLGYNPDEDPTKQFTNCDEIFIYSQNWSMITRDQLEFRPHRRGTRVNVQVTDLVCPKTIDEEIRVRVTNKQCNAMKLQDLRGIMNRLKELI